MDTSKASDIVLKAVNPQGFKLHGTIDMHGLHIKVENRKGSVRSGKDPGGKEWSIKMTYPYGYISRTKAADDEHVDCYVGDNRKSEKVFVIHQVVPKTGKYDEDKCMLGFNSSKEAKKAYLNHYDSPKFFGSMTEMTIDKFKESLKKNKGMKLTKAIDIIQSSVITEIQFSENIVKGIYISQESIEKGASNTGLIQKKVWVSKNGKTYQTTVWVREGDDSKAPNQSKNVPVGESIGEVSGMDVRRYSEKAILIKGDTYANKETMQRIKSEIGVGTFNRKLEGWVFPVRHLATVLGSLFSKLKDDGHDEKAEAVKNQKNELPEGTKVNVAGQDGTISSGASTNEGIKYNIKSKDGSESKIDEKVITTSPEADDMKISEILDSSNASNRATTAKQLYGIKEISDIYKYSLSEYMNMHGISQEEIDAAVSKLTSKTTTGSSHAPFNSSGESKKSDPKKKEGLTRQQLISKLVYSHYQSVRAAIANGEPVSDSILSTYPDLKADAKKEREAMSEETKRKIAEALRGRGKGGEDEKQKKIKSGETKESKSFDKIMEQVKSGIPAVTFKEDVLKMSDADQQLIMAESRKQANLKANNTKQEIKDATAKINKIIAERNAKKLIPIVEGIPNKFNTGIFTYEITGVGSKENTVMISVKGKEPREFTKEKAKDLYERSDQKAKIDYDNEESKKKIAAQKAAEKFIDSMSTEDLNSVKEQFSEAVSKKLIKEQSKLAAILSELESLKKKSSDLSQKKKDETDYTKRGKLDVERYNVLGKMTPVEAQLGKQKNIVNVLTAGGSLVEVTDLVGVAHPDTPDFTAVDTRSIIIDQDTILETERPSYIPEIDRDKFRRKSFIFDSIKVGDNKYMIATSEYSEHSEIRDGLSVSNKGDYDPNSAGYVMLTLDQLVLTQDYYTKMEKAEMKAESVRKNERELERWHAMSDEKKERYMTQRYFYEGMPAKAKKTITKEAFEALTWQEKEKIYIPVKKHGMKKIKSKFDEKHMAGSFHAMYERFKNPKALRKTKDGKILNRGQVSYGTSYAHGEAWASWGSFRETLDWKINDLNVQREEISGLRTQAIETSYGESGTKDDLLKEHGIKVKRQNGSDIKPAQVEQIKKAWTAVESSFGTLKQNAKDDGLKISHAGETYMFASKAVGVFVPSMMTIGVTAKLGTDQLGFTLGHEVAHYMDNTVGKTKGTRFASDDYDSTAGKLAIKFRGLMNEKTDSKYLNSTHECFARAFEQYNAGKTMGDGAIRAGKDTYSASAAYVNKDIFNLEVSPLIEQFLKENRSLLKAASNDLVIFEASKILSQ